MKPANYALKAALIEHNGTITEASRKLDIAPDRLSRIIHGRVNVRQDEKRRICWHLQKSAVELFGNNEIN